MTKYPHTHFTKWNHYLAVRPLIGHLISPSPSLCSALLPSPPSTPLPPSPPPRPSEGGWCEAAGRYGVSRSTWKDSTGVSGQDATHRHPGLSSIRIGKCAGWRRRIKISVDGGGVERAASEQTRFTRRCLLQREPFNVAVRSAAPSFRLSWLTII